MQSPAAISHRYARVFELRAQMTTFCDVLRRTPGWRQNVEFLSASFDLAFRFFLDAPTPDRLETIMLFEADIARIARQLPELARFCRPR